jgi:hypothetical protein
MTKATSARFRYRPLTAWLERFGALVLALALLAGLMSPTAAQDATPAATPVESTPATPGSGIPGLGGADITATVDAMLAVQGADGGFIGFSGESDPGTTADAVIGLAAAEEAGVDTGDAIDEALSYLEAAGADYAATGAGQRAKLVLAVEAGGDDASSFGGEDIWAPIEATSDDSDLTITGSFSLSLVVLAALVVESDRTAEFTDLLVANQLEDGSWASEPDAASGKGDTNTTALAIQALVAAGDVEDPAIESGLDYIATVRAPRGGYAYQPPVDGATIVPDANSSALVLQALVATMTPVDDPTFQQDAAALAAFQNDSGQFRYTNDTPDDNLFATVQALPAIAGLPLPIAA